MNKIRYFGDDGSLTIKKVKNDEILIKINTPYQSASIRIDSNTFKEEILNALEELIK
jgi:hypothetical protein